jgi:hypothetical protein
VERLDEVIADLLQVDPDTLTDVELHQLVVALHRQTLRLACARAGVVAVGRPWGVGRRRLA